METLPANGGRAAQERKLLHDDTPNQPIVHSGRLIYAKPQDLPSFPSIGLDAKGSAASAAASLGWANKKSPEPWRPGKSASASTAAIMAKDYKSAPAWEPVASSNGAKAALLASQSARSNSAWQPSSTDDGLSAANLAFKANRTAPRNIRSDTLEHNKSLVAAKGAVARRKRAESAPIPRESYPDEANAAANALSAATRAHRPVRSPIPIEEAGAVPYTTMNRLMFTSRPPVKPEVDEQKRADVLHASAVAMAKKMYSQQQKMIEAKKNHEDKTAPRADLEVSSSISNDPQPAQLTTLQDAAYKQAQARLAKMQEENAKNRDLQDYYGTKPLSRRFSVKTKLRRRASSDGAVIEDHRRSQQIRNQMSLFSNKLSEVDEQKRQHDQEFLLAAAQRNVHQRLKGMDEKIASETGMVPPSTLTQWELKAHAVAQSRTHQRESLPHGKVDIGAGKYMDQDEINAIAARRVQPVLDEINEKAEQEHARQAELRLEMERKKEEQEIEKARQKEIHDMQKKLKQQGKQEEKEKKAEEKQEAKVKREEEKAAKAEQKRLARAEKTRPAERDEEAGEEPEIRDNLVTMNSSGQPVSIPRPSTQEAPTRSTTDKTSEEVPKSPGDKSPSKVKSWFKSRFSRGTKSPDDEQSKEKPSRRSFIGGASLTGTHGNDSSVSVDSRSTSVRAVAMAGRSSNTRQSQRSEDPEVVSPLSSESGDEYFRDENRDQPRTELTPPRPIRDFSPAKSRSPTRDSRFHEII
ncbi:hypothetical protein F5Y19DRAFT_490275 [Xylariaceae sp. FL1651]|nr:hypothetical protein F5Y19DRAFT_490275 [Xylariaceae sp. FL1651]